MTEVGYWRQVKTWPTGANDKCGDCFLAMVANLHVLVTTVMGHPYVMSDEEVERAYTVWKGFDPNNPATDVGMSVEETLKDWCKTGWPGMAWLKPPAYFRVSDSIPNWIEQYGGVCAWCYLPVDENDDPIMGDRALAKYASTDPHAVLIVGHEPGYYQLATWGAVYRVSEAWWAKFGRETFVVVHPQWRKPTP